MDIDDLTLRKLRQLQGINQTFDDHPYHVGKNYFIRTVTHHFTGKLIRVTKHELVLMDAAWISDDGRFHDAMTKGTLNEVEPYLEGQEVIIGRGSIIDACVWGYDLPKEQK